MSDDKIQMVDLVSQYHRLQAEIDDAMRQVVESGVFINGRQVGEFAGHLAEYLGAPHVIPCANGTDALQIALMRLDLPRGAEVVMPAITYAAAAEAAILLGLTPVLADVDSRTFNISPLHVGEAISKRTGAILVVHLFGQCCDMHPVMEIAGRYNLPVIEDNAQSLGAEYTFPDGSLHKAGAMSDVGCLSFFPTKILGCYGDGGALVVSDGDLAERVRMTTLHGQSEKYHHYIIGCNSRLDTLQAALLNVKLKYIDDFIASRRRAAAFYDEALRDVDGIILPLRHPSSTHVYHQYTIQVKANKRDALRSWLKEKGVPTSVYYPLVIDEQEAFRGYVRISGELSVARRLSRNVLSLPLHTEMTESQLERISFAVASFF